MTLDFRWAVDHRTGDHAMRVGELPVKLAEVTDVSPIGGRAHFKCEVFLPGVTRVVGYATSRDGGRILCQATVQDWFTLTLKEKVQV